MPRLVVVGDHRRPLWLDFWHPRHEASRRAVFAAIAAARPELVLDTGDLVAGAFASSWRAFDRDTAALRGAGAAIEAVAGNHETYGVIPRSAHAPRRLREFLARFPRDGGARWGARDLGATRLLLLDSNERVLSGDERASQEAWLERAVADADADARVALVLAAWHHPPFTNTTRYGDDRFSSRSFLPRLRRSQKLGAIFCGHVHAYERFHVDGIALVTTGGGGAEAHRFPRDHARWRHTPAFDATALPHFHYVAVEIDGAVGRVSSRHFAAGSNGAVPRWLEGDRFEILPRSRAAASRR